MKNTTDNLNELLQRFVDASLAETMAEDIRQGDAMLDRYPGPFLSPEATMRLRLRLRTVRAKRHRRTLLLGCTSAAAAAVAVIVVMVGWTEQNMPSVPLESKPIAQVLPHELPGFTLNLWDDTLHSESDESFAAIRSELDNIAEAMEAVRIENTEFYKEHYRRSRDIEQINTKAQKVEFWKG
jgi:hypothetical protein